MNEKSVALIRVKKAGYPKSPPFDPHVLYPEYPFGEKHLGAEPNYVYEGVRESLRFLGLDNHQFGSPRWNPLGEIIRPGDRVVLKPNFVMHENRSGGTLESVITHGSILRAILDFVLIALQGRGEIFVVDAPQYEADFEKIIEISGTRELIKGLAERTHLPIALVDLRLEQAIELDGLVVGRKKLSGDPKGYVRVDLGRGSFFDNNEKWANGLRGSDYDGIETEQHHTNNKHEYLIAKTILEADVIINVPKLKTHRKTGVTLCLKNMIGINGDKNWIPHYRIGGPLRGGDEHSSSSRLRDFECIVKDKFKGYVFNAGPVGLFLSQKARKVQKTFVDHTKALSIRGGSWYGNDTLWRSILDLNRLLLYADSSGILHDVPQRRYLAVIDGIIGGQGDGPYHTESVDSACLIVGQNPVCVDLIAATFMGFDYRKIPKIIHALKNTEIEVLDSTMDYICCNDTEWIKRIYSRQGCINFRPAFSWVGHIEGHSSL